MFFFLYKHLMFDINDMIYMIIVHSHFKLYLVLLMSLESPYNPTSTSNVDDLIGLAE